MKTQKRSILIECIIGATPKIDMPEIGWIKGTEYKVCVNKFTGGGGFQIYKDTEHFNEKSGHKSYLTISDIEKDFVLQRGQKTIYA